MMDRLISTTGRIAFNRTFVHVGLVAAVLLAGIAVGTGGAAASPDTGATLESGPQLNSSIGTDTLSDGSTSSWSTSPFNSSSETDTLSDGSTSSWSTYSYSDMT